MDGESASPISDEARAWLHQLSEPTATGLDEIRHLVQLFIDDGRARVTSMHEAAARGDLNRVRVLAHDLRGSSATFGAEGVAAGCRRVEALADDADIEGVRSTIADVEAALSVAAAALSAEFVDPRGEVSPPSDG